MSSVIKTPRQLYKFLLKSINKLPEGTRDYYRRFVRQHFKSHSDETDPERINQIISKAIVDAQWLLKKYKVKE